MSDVFINTITNMNNIYGSGKAADFIVDKLKSEPLSVVKIFKDHF